MILDRNAGQKTRSFSLRTLLWLAAVLTGPASVVWSADDSALARREYQVKAAFLFNFAKYGEWPAGRLFSPPFRFCITDRTDMVENLAERLKDSRVHELTIDVLLLNDAQVQSCHLLFIAQSTPAARQRELLAATQGFSILAIGESPSFLDDGGAVRFFIAAGTVHFDVHIENLQRQRLQLSSKLLRLADTVHGRKADGQDEPARDEATP